MLNSSDQYREYSEQYLAYHKYFHGDSGFTEGSSLNDRVGKQYLTDLRVYQVPEKYMQEKKIAEHIWKGRSFKKNEYQRSLDKTIPLIAGYEYQKIFKLNEKIQGGYVGEENYTYQIVGFFVYRNEKEWKEMVRLMKKIRKETGYKFVIPKTTQD